MDQASAIQGYLGASPILNPTHSLWRVVGDHAPSYVNTYFPSLPIQILFIFLKLMIWIMLRNDKVICGNDYPISGHIQFECGRYSGWHGLLQLHEKPPKYCYEYFQNQVKELAKRCAYIILNS